MFKFIKEKFTKNDNENKSQTLENIIDLLPIHIYWYDLNGTIKGVNLSQAIDDGYKDKKEIIGKNVYDFQSSQKDNLKKVNDHIISTGEAVSVEESYVFPDQRHATVLSKKVPLRNNNGQITGIVGISFDITDQKRAIELENHEKILNETIRLLQLLAGAIAHEIRTPLATISAIGMVLQKILPSLIKGYNTSVENKLIKADIRAIQLSLADDAAKSLQKEANEANAFIDDVLGNVKLLALSKDSLDTLSIKEVVESAIERFNFEDESERKLVHINIEQDFEFKGTAIFMQHVFFNLIKNALHYIHEAKKGEIYISTEVTSQWNILYFKDTGPGMDDEIAKSIFDKGFVSKRTGGTGVGLGFCKQIILQCEGEISCKSKKGEFTEFVIKLPYLTK